ncbi:MAG: sarcosine oxidase subunit alpha family protein [Acidisphaera sp.]|nr:sarcosine oxidase subunit alpha family protein [Acidisphaera sp.]
MSQRFRTAAGGRIDRARPLGFSFDGRGMEGFAGDTLASALLANGVHLVGRSFKYHRPRGILAAGSEEPNALVEIDRGAGRRTPNLRATQVELHDGLVARSQNRWPSLAFDAGAVSDRLAPLLPTGFYYKTFLWPPRAWARLYEPLIRRAAGLGRAPDTADPDRYVQCYAHCDVLVIGAGPAGLAAARAAAGSGARVIVCDEGAEFGGSLLAEERARIGGVPAAEWLRDTLARLEAAPETVLLARTTAFGYYAQNMVGLIERVTDHLAAPDPALPRERLWQVRAREVIVAAGSIERPLVFPGNDRPGIMLAGAVQSYVVRYGVRPGRRAVVAAEGDSAYRAALALHAAGVEVAMVADLRDAAEGALPQMARDAGIPVRSGATIVGTAGRLRVRSVTIGFSGGRERVAADLLCMGGGWTPSLHLYSQARGRPRHDPTIGFVPRTPVPGLTCVGACRGVFGLAEMLADGAQAGAAAAMRAGFAASGESWAVEDAPSCECAPPRAPGPGSGRAFVDFQNDVTAKDLRLATREGFRSIEHVKRYTTTGMATDQGKTSNVNALGIVAQAVAAPVEAVGLTTFRPPYTPVSFGALAGVARGALFDPVRTTAIHGWAAAQGALFEDVGAWKRARCFPRAGEDMHVAVARECRTVRETVGLFDASTLGKIEVVGRDAAVFLERMYVNALANLAPGRCRYAVLLGESGFVRDDGIVGRLSADRFHVTTGTGNAALVLGLMEDYSQTEWPELQVWLTSVTEQWAVIAVQGPRAREAIAPLVEDVDLSRQALPHMSVRSCQVCGVAARLFAVSFTGEIGFEINVGADHGLAVWEQVWERVQGLGGAVYGTEAMHVLRAEKGYVIVGQETDGTVTIDDLGLGWAIGRKKQDFVGKRSLSRPDLAAAGRRQLVGLALDDASRLPEEGMQVTAAAQDRTAIGHVTSAYGSGTVGRAVVMALVADGRARMGEIVFVQMTAGAMAARVCDPVLVDPEGARLHG